MNDAERSRRRLIASMGLASGAAVFAPWVALAAPRKTPEIETSLGRIRGESAGGVYSFKGVRYGADTASRRFQAPLPAAPWRGVRDATRFASRAPQAARTPHPLATSWTDRSAPDSEDCLFLNIWTPGVNDLAKRPVMVWLHGGGFSSGSGANVVNDGTRLASRGDVVVVTLNHRLNVFGYLYLAELGGDAYADSGVCGLLDVVLALQWIRDNIERFGGDPANVTIFGESGGGAKISLLLGMPAAKGLFHKAIIQSGAYLNGMSKPAGSARAERYLHDLGVAPAKLDRIMRMPTQQLVNALGGAETLAQRIAFSPVVDGGALPADPFAPVATPLVADVPLLVGNTRWEYIYQLGDQDPTYFDLTFETLPSQLAAALRDLSIPADAGEVIEEYRRFYPRITASDLFFLAITDGRMLIKSVLMAERKLAQPAPVFMYMLEWYTPMGEGKWRSPHALDVPLVFDNVSFGRSMTGEGPEQDRLAAQMSEAWIAFARAGSPQTNLLPHWPAYDAACRATMIFDVHSRVQNDPASEKRRYWAPKILGA